MLSCFLTTLEKKKRGRGEKKKKKQIKNGDYKMPSQISDAACDLISKMLQVVPEKRIDIKGIMNHKLLEGYV